jgi:hypothetical protein
MQTRARLGHRHPIGSAAFAVGAVLLAMAQLLSGAPRAKSRPSEQRETTPVDCAVLKLAIVDLRDTFGARYPQGDELLQRLAALETKLAAVADDATARAQIQAALAALQREALLANPLVSGQPLLFVVRSQYQPDHHNTATMFQTGEINTGSFRGGGALKTIDFGRGGEVQTLIQLPDGIVRDPDVHFDGHKILVALRRDRDDDYHLYEINADGTQQTQLTSGRGVSDIDPIYLPGGKILFTSTREPKYCQCNRHIMGNLFTCAADGSDVEQIGHSTLHEGHASLLPDGRVIYDRWEYVDRNFGDAQGLWTVNPDGTNHAVYYGNNTPSPGAVLEGRAVPGTELMLTTFSSCHDRPWGALALIDHRRGIDGKPPVLRTWPASAIDLVGVGNYDTFKRVQPKYEDPYPLSAKYFLCSRATGDGEQMGLFLLDVFGNELLLHSEAPGCFDPMPLAARPAPPAIPTRVDHAQQDGYFYVEDVYSGSEMERIERGVVKSLRVVEVPEKRFWTDQAWNGSGTQAPGMAYDDFNNKRILGTAPVQRDGSAYFSVPADTFVYFQLLDERGMMVQSMRSGTMVRPGETVSCVGCHDNRHQTVGPSAPAQAMQRPPSPLAPWYGPPRNFSYTQEVQPVFAQHCTTCHDYGKPAGERLNLAGDLGLAFNTSYFELRSKKLVSVIGAGSSQIQPPQSWGSHASRLAQVLLDGHGDEATDQQLHLDREAFERIVTWIDINAPYYPEYSSVYRGNRYGRSPLDDQQLARLSELTGVQLHAQQYSAHLSFTRPELSLALRGLKDRNDSAYREALAIIQAGAEALSQRPREDMPGSRLEGIDAEREAKYQASVRAQAQTRQQMIEARERPVRQSN